MWKHLGILALAASASAVAVSLPAPDRLVEAPTATPGWVRIGTPATDDAVSIKVSIKNQNLDDLFKFVQAVSDPASPVYAQYMSAEEVNTMTAPREDDINAVEKWIASTSDSYTIDRVQGIVSADFTVAGAEALFSTKFHTTMEVATGKQRIRAIDYKIPASVSHAVKAVYGMHGLPLPPVKTADPVGDAAGMPPPITPAVLSETYELKSARVAGGTKNRMAVAEFQGQFMNTSDLAAFFKTYLPDLPKSDSEVYAFHGKEVNGDGIEAQLDIQFIMGTAPGIKTEFYEQANMDFCADLKNWTSLLLATDDVPWVHSVSYGWQGNLTQIGCKDDEVTDVDADFAKLAARGVSIVFASGDSGSGWAPPQPPQPAQCSHTEPGTADMTYKGDILRVLKIGVPPGNNQEGPWICCTIAGEIGSQEHYAGWSYTANPCKPGEPCEANCTILKTVESKVHMKGAWAGKAAKPPPAPPKPKAAMLWPSWPASSPFVTAVGATRFIGDKIGADEGSVNLEDHFGSGGGFSPWTFLKQGTWQKDAVDHYFKTVPPSTLPDPSGATYDKNGRATPDVSALGTGYAVINNGKPLPGGVGGTSASAPVFAGVIALINDARIAAGKKSLGLLNPFIYANPDAFTDVTVGSNKFLRGGGVAEYGFNCTKGWDPVTGVGTPLFPKMLKAAMDLP